MSWNGLLYVKQFLKLIPSFASIPNYFEVWIKCSLYFELRISYRREPLDLCLHFEKGSMQIFASLVKCHRQNPRLLVKVWHWVSFCQEQYWNCQHICSMECFHNNIKGLISICHRETSQHDTNIRRHYYRCGISISEKGSNSWFFDHFEEFTSSIIQKIRIKHEISRYIERVSQHGDKERHSELLKRRYCINLQVKCFLLSGPPVLSNWIIINCTYYGSTMAFL